uniref:Uncharacterized protein n=1 Tax=Anguilla anguilla TaxID=7936 RepID=A0A0E9UJE7_ANGAN
MDQFRTFSQRLYTKTAQCYFSLLHERGSYVARYGWEAGCEKFPL